MQLLSRFDKVAVESNQHLCCSPESILPVDSKTNFMSFLASLCISASWFVSCRVSNF